MGDRSEFSARRSAVAPDVRKALPAIVGSVFQEFFSSQTSQMYTVGVDRGYVTLTPRHDAFPRITVRLRPNDEGIPTPHTVYVTAKKKRMVLGITHDEHGTPVLLKKKTVNTAHSGKTH